jgi:predicted RNase H-like HicB family nuclease
MERMTYNVIYEGSDATGWSAYVPDLPGIAVAGDTLDAVRELMPGAVQMHIAGMREDGIAIPAPTAMLLGAVAASV